MVSYLMICRSLTYAQRAARALERSGISAFVIRTPREVSAEGCGYCVRISEKNLASALVTLKHAELSPGKIFVAHEDGRLREVSL